MRWKPLRNGSPCGTGDSFNARCGFAPPGTNAGTKARIRYLFSSDYRNGLLVKSAAMRCGVPVFMIERVCPFELEAAKASAAVLT